MEVTGIAAGQPYLEEQASQRGASDASSHTADKIANGSSGRSFADEPAAKAALPLRGSDAAHEPAGASELQAKENSPPANGSSGQDGQQQCKIPVAGSKASSGVHHFS